MGAVSHSMAKVLSWTAITDFQGTLSIERPNADFIINEKLQDIIGTIENETII